jgi:hypothetical protein
LVVGLKTNQTTKSQGTRIEGLRSGKDLTPLPKEEQPAKPEKRERRRNRRTNKGKKGEKPRGRTIDTSLIVLGSMGCKVYSTQYAFG